MATPETHPMAVSDEILAVAYETAMRDMILCLRSCAYKGDWETAKNKLDDGPIAKEVLLTQYGLEILDCAAFAGQWEFFNEMVQMMDAQTLSAPLEDGDFIIERIATVTRSMKSAKALVEKCPSLTQTKDSWGWTPLCASIYHSNDPDLVWYLALVTTDEDPGRPFSGPHAADLLWVLLCVAFYDLTHFLLQKYHHLAEILFTAKSTNGIPALKALASKPFDFPSGTKLGWLARRIYPFAPVDVDDIKPPSHILQELGASSFSKCTNHQLGMQSSKKSLKWRKFQSLVWNVMGKIVPSLQRIRDTKFKHECAIKLVYIACQETKWSLTSLNDPDYGVILETLKEATASGIIEILSIYREFFPLPINTSAHADLLRVAAENRQDKVFNFFLREHPKCRVNFYADGGMNSLHVVAKLRDCPKITSIAGAPFQLQRELQWLKGIEKMLNPFAMQQRNYEEQTPWEFFRKEHETMHIDAEKWMKNTANSCMLVATLIATVVFAAAFTVPGGNNQDTGTPIFLQKKTFMLFALSDAVALFSSVNSLWMFLSILTARFAQEDFLETLPKKLIFGLSTLFLAIVSSIIAFGAALSLVLGHRQNEVIIVIVLMAFISVAMFAILQLPLFIEMVRSTYCSNLLGS